MPELCIQIDLFRDAVGCDPANVPNVQKLQSSSVRHRAETLGGGVNAMTVGN